MSRYKTLNSLYGMMVYEDTDSLKEVFHSGKTHAETDELFNEDEVNDAIYNTLIDLRSEVNGLIHKAPYKSEDIDAIYEHDMAIYQALHKIDKFIRSVI